MSALTIRMSGTDITASVDQTSVVMQLAGSQDTASCEYDIIDPTNAISVTDEALTTVTEVGSATVLFGGFVRSRTVTAMAVGRVIHVLAFDYNQILDRQIVISDKRSAGESDNARLQYLMTTYGTQLSSDFSQITTLNSSMPAQKFVALTLRQALERVMGQASVNAAYYVDTTGRLVYYNRTTVTAAPFNVSLTQPPGGGNLAPSDFRIDNDSSNMANAVYVVGATAAGSGWFTDTTSISTYGRRERFINAPDADTHAKASAVGNAMLRDQKNPLRRGVFTTQSPNDGWRIGQTINVTSAAHGLAATAFRVARVTVRYLDPAGDRDYTIEIGGPLATISAQLGATFGGGGGFPWHSPAGPGVWAPVISSGGSTTTGGGSTVSGGGGCACNTPYAPGFVLDTYARVVSPTWGTASSGGTWIVAGSTGLTESVDGTYGIIDGTAVSSALYRFEEIPLPAGYGFGTEALIRFMYTGTWNSFQVLLTDVVGVFASHAGMDSHVTAGLIHLFPGASGSGTDTSGGTGLNPVASTSTFYLLRVGWPDNATVQCRVWAESATEPSDWQATDNRAVGAAWTPAYLMVGIYGGMKLFIDTITFNSTGAPASGQPYPKTYLRNGDGFTQSFSTLTPFLPGSLLVYVDNIPQTTYSENGPASNFYLLSPPTTSQKVSASWTAA